MPRIGSALWSRLSVPAFARGSVRDTCPTDSAPAFAAASTRGGRPRTPTGSGIVERGALAEYSVPRHRVARHVAPVLHHKMVAGTMRKPLWRASSSDFPPAPVVAADTNVIVGGKMGRQQVMVLGGPAGPPGLARHGLGVPASRGTDLICKYPHTRKCAGTCIMRNTQVRSHCDRDERTHRPSAWGSNTSTTAYGRLDPEAVG